MRLHKECQQCHLNAPNNAQPPPRPIKSNYVLERIQIDLIDKRNQPDGDYKWILHIRCHFSKYSAIFPLKSKSAAEVADRIAFWIASCEPAKILQCDNGTEFKAVLLILLKVIKLLFCYII